MNYLVTSEQMKIAEVNAVHRGVSLLTLAQNAALSCFNYISQIVEQIQGRSFAVLCGGGMNGSDGMLIASLLRQAGGEVLCIFVGDSFSAGLAQEVYAAYAPTLITTAYSSNEDAVKYTLQGAHIIIDCVFGTGFREELDYKTSELFNYINNSCNCLKFSVDLPSGVNADTGQRASNAFVPNITLILGAYKKGLLCQSPVGGGLCNRDYCGDYSLMDIGLIEQDYTHYEAKFTTPQILAHRPKRPATSHKGNFGKLLNIAGSERYIGAALLSTKAAVKTGAGLVALAAPEQVITAIAQAIPEAVFTRADLKSITTEIQTADAVSIGCGIGVSSDSRKITEFVIRTASCPIILDADGINSICDNINVLRENKSVILTPHPGEFSRLTGLTVAEIQSNRIDCAKLFAKESGAVVVLKGVNTVIASPGGNVAVNPTGNAGLAKSGTGDVLTGVIGSLAAQGVALFEAAVLGVYLHGLAADKLAEGVPLSRITASDIANNI
jgi:NAD(P)H-hydrate epimerase